MSRISVAMPTYNGAKYLAEQLASLATQTRLPDELVIVDDASKDDTISVAEQFAAGAPFAVRIFRNEKGLGCNGNFAHAIELCDGELIALCDQDDVWHAEHLAALAAPLESDANVVLTISNSEYVDEQLRPTNTTLWRAERFDARDVRRIERGPQFGEWVRHHVVAGHALMFRASLREAMLPFHPYQTYDHWLSLIAAACGRVVMIDRNLTLHRHHASQTIGHDDMSLAERARQQKAVAADFFPRHIDVWQSLQARLAAHRSMVTAPDVDRVIERRLRLLKARHAMRQGGTLRRVVMSARQLLAGNYHQAGRGWLTFARDLRG